MKKLLASPKFWAITIGALLGSCLYYFLGDGVGLSNGFPMLIVGAYSSIALAGKAEDIAKGFNNNSKINNNGN